jgi:hypothetical protein
MVQEYAEAGRELAEFLLPIIQQAGRGDNEMPLPWKSFNPGVPKNKLPEAFFPVPISSARQAPQPASANSTIHSKPLCW